MIDYACFCQIKHLHVHAGLNASQIAQTLTLDPRTVTYWLAQEHFRPRKPRPRHSKLDPFKPAIVQMLERYPYSAAQVFQRLREHGFAGGYSLVKTYVRTVRPRRQAAFLRLAFAPGECAQVDWGSFGSVPVGQTQRRLSFFVMVLCYSRMLYVEFTVSQTMEHFLACHQHAFEFFGGIPHKIMVDNLKSAVLKRTLGAAPVFNPTYADFAAHCGFTIAPCNVGKGNEKGRVENGVGYVKKNFLAGLEIPDFSALNPAATHWLETVANVRVHGETREQPTVLWHTERPSLRPLPLHPFDIATVAQVRASRQFRVTVETNRYSVPAQYASHALTLKTYPDRLCIYLGDQLIARHTRHYDRFQDVEDPDHPKPLLEQRKSPRSQGLHALSRPLASGGGLLPQAGGAAPQSAPSRAQNRRFERHLRPGSRGQSDGGCLGLRGVLLGIHCQSGGATRPLHPRGERSPSHPPRRSPGRQPRPPDLSIYHAHPQPGAHDTEEEPRHG